MVQHELDSLTSMTSGDLGEPADSHDPREGWHTRRSYRKEAPPVIMTPRARRRRTSPD